MGALSRLLGRRKPPPFNPDKQPEPLQASKWVSSNLLVQAESDQVSDLLPMMPAPGGRPPGQFTHIVNLYPPPEGDRTQANTVASMRRAAAAHDGPVRLLNIQSAGDPDQTPEGFARGPDLSRSVLDVAPLEPARPLPLLFDVLENGAAEAGEQDYLVFTNADICLQPHFYAAVSDLIDRGFDALVINRRTVGAAFAGMPDSPLLAAETGTTHPGFDCFVFSHELAREFRRNDACIGMRAVDQGLLYNMVAHAEKMLLLTNATLTYHFGDDATWTDDRYAQYTAHNERAYLETLRALFTEMDDPEPLIGYFRSCFNPIGCRKIFHELFPEQSWV